MIDPWECMADAVGADDETSCAELLLLAEHFVSQGDSIERTLAIQEAVYHIRRNDR